MCSAAGEHVLLVIVSSVDKALQNFGTQTLSGLTRRPHFGSGPLRCFRTIRIADIPLHICVIRQITEDRRPRSESSGGPRYLRRFNSSFTS
jgi:hypothetical protein